MLASSPINSSPTTTGPPGTNNLNTNAPATSSTKYLSKQDREALLQYTKHFVRKAVQIIVQSRLGDKKPTKSRVYAYNADWFNLSVKDLAQITTLTKSSLSNAESLFNAKSPFCVEISLRTPENQTMILETWCILFNDQQVDSGQKICFSVYKKMSLVLRSLICITRSIPTYQLSRRQNSDTYVLLYRMYCGEPIVHHLGENYGTAKVGTVGTPVGSIIVNVAYRTRLTMTPQNSSHCTEYTGGIQIKDDHFIPEHGIDTSKVSSSYNRYSPNDHLLSELNMIPGSPLNDKSPGRMIYEQQQHHSSSSSSSLSKRSSSNLNTIAEVAANNSINSNKNRDIDRASVELKKEKSTARVSSKTQPIPMKSSVSQQIISNSSKLNDQNDTVSTNTPKGNVATSTSTGKNVQMQRFNSEFSQHVTNNEESSADEYSSSVGSTPDTIYYFKLKSAAFVPSTSFTNNFYSSSVGNLANDNELPPFIALLSNDFSNLSTLDKQQQQQLLLQQNDNRIAQSPPPPNNMIDFNSHLKTSRQARDNSMLDERLASPCSLPNFKMLDNNQNQFLNTQISNNQTEPDDFVFIESKKIAFGLSNAADDLRNFFRACENAPMLDSFQNEPLFNDILKDLDQQLLSYESKVAEFDELIKSLDNN